MGNCIIIASGKGGTGKSSLAAGVGSSLAKMGKKTLCIDGDVGLRGLDMILGVSDIALMDFYDVAEGSVSFESAVIRHPLLENLYILSAPISKDPADFSEEKAAEVVESAKKYFDFCIVDAPAGLGEIFKMFVPAVDSAIVVSTAENVALRDAQKTAAELEKMNIKNGKLVVNRVRPGLLNKTRLTIDDAIDRVGLPLLGIVPEDKNVILSGDFGQPIALTKIKGAAKAYQNIALRLIGEKAPLMNIRKG